MCVPRVQVLLSRRMGFVRLAVESGAQLVPVLAIGEEAVGGAYASTLTAALLLPAKRVPLHVSVLHKTRGDRRCLSAHAACRHVLPKSNPGRTGVEHSAWCARPAMGLLRSQQTGPTHTLCPAVNNWDPGVQRLGEACVVMLPSQPSPARGNHRYCHSTTDVMSWLPQLF